MRNAADFVVDLVEELSAEDKALVPHFDLTAESDEYVSSPHPVIASVHSSSPEANAEDEEVRFLASVPGTVVAHCRASRWLCLRWRVLVYIISVGLGRVCGRGNSRSNTLGTL